MKERDTDRDWELFGQSDPYWAVVTHEKYHINNLNNDTIEEFYETGEKQIDWILTTIRKQLDPSFKPVSAMDFGCGVGRLSLGLAKRCRSVVGVDISNGMLSGRDRVANGWA